jgi:CheY-like chemotaxis protein
VSRGFVEPAPVTSKSTARRSKSTVFDPLSLASEEQPFETGLDGLPFRARVALGMRRLALIVEDDPTLQRAMRAELDAAKFDVLLAYDLDTAVRHLAKSEPQLVCVDLGLPSASGYEVCEYIRRQSHLLNVPILVTSERGFPEDMAHAEEAGADAFLKKPFTMKRLMKYITALLDGPSTSRPSIRRLRIP